MYETRLPVPAPAERVWRELTDPAVVGGWFGAEVEWILEPGAPATFTEPDGTVRHGVIEHVEPERSLRWRWWTDADGGEAGDASVVTYTLDPDDESDGTVLTVTEEVVPPAGAPVAASASVAARRWSPDRWTEWDDRFIGVWAGITAPTSVASR